MEKSIRSNLRQGLPARVKGKVYSSVVRPALVYELETVAVTKKQVKEMKVAEIKMLRFAMGVTKKDKIRNKYIRSTVKVERLGMKMREGRLRRYGDVMRRDQKYIGRKMMEMENWKLERFYSLDQEEKKEEKRKEKRKTKEKIFRCSERRYGGSCCKGDGR